MAENRGPDGEIWTYEDLKYVLSDISHKIRKTTVINSLMEQLSEISEKYHDLNQEMEKKSKWVEEIKGKRDAVVKAALSQPHAGDDFKNKRVVITEKKYQPRIQEAEELFEATKNSVESLEARMYTLKTELEPYEQIVADIEDLRSQVYLLASATIRVEDLQKMQKRAVRIMTQLKMDAYSPRLRKQKRKTGTAQDDVESASIAADKGTEQQEGEGGHFASIINPDMTWQATGTFTSSGGTSSGASIAADKGTEQQEGEGGHFASMINPDMTWQATATFTSSGGIHAMADSDVVLHVWPGSVTPGTEVAVSSAICSDIDYVHEKLQLSEDEEIASPLAEFDAGADFSFQRPVSILLPCFFREGYDLSLVRVYCVTRGQTAHIEKTLLRPKHPSESQLQDDSESYATRGGMFEVLNEELIRVTTDHFSGYVAAGCRGPKTPTVARWSVYGCNEVKGDQQSAVITAYACADTRLKIADFRKEYKISSQELIEEDVVPLRKLKLPKKSKLCVRLVTVGCNKDRWQTCLRDAETPAVPLEQSQRLCQIYGCDKESCRNEKHKKSFPIIFRWMLETLPPKPDQEQTTGTADAHVVAFSTEPDAVELKAVLDILHVSGSKTAEWDGNTKTHSIPFLINPTSLVERSKKNDQGNQVSKEFRFITGNVFLRLSDRLGHDWFDYIVVLPGWEKGTEPLHARTVIEQAQLNNPHSTKQQIMECLMKWAQNSPGVVNRKNILSALEDLEMNELKDEIIALFLEGCPTE